MAKKTSAARKRKPLDPSLNVRGEQPYVAIPIRVSLREWGRANALVGEVFDWLARQGVPPGGPPFFRYRTIGGMDAPFDLEVGVPVARPLGGDSPVIAGHRPAGAYAVAVHTGHPDRLDGAHEELQAWVRDQDLRVAMGEEGDVWEARFESFLTDPAQQPDLERWSIEIAYLLDLPPAEAST